MNIKELQAENMFLREVIKDQNAEIDYLQTKLNNIEEFIERYINENSLRNN